MQRNMAHQLPGRLQWAVTSWNGNWPPSLTTVAKVLAGAEVPLACLSVKNHSKFQRHDTGTALLVCTYSALFFFLTAALSGLIRTHKFGEFPVRESWKSDTTQWGHTSKRSWVWMMRHCLISLIAGTISLIAQVLLYGWLEESLFVKGTLSIILAFAVLFLKHLIRLLLRD
ncbi:hypothetical protein H4582DRAFT_1973039 [Lactarius indigo]|nr:hypothetical protein H4582DRAFT_1973039 [Lactarius indigo]